MPRGRSISSCLDCADPTNPTGPPSTAAGSGRPRRSGPAAGTARSVRCRWQAPRRRAGRPTGPPRPPSGSCPGGSARSAARSSATSDTTSLSAGQPRTGDAGGHHRRIAQHRCPAGERGVGLGDDVVAVGDVLGDVDLPAGVDQAHHHARDVVGEPRQVGLGADRRERLPVDLGGVADVVEHPLTLRVCVAQPVSVSGRHQHVPGRRAAAGPIAADEVPVRRCSPWRRLVVASARTSAAECSQPGLPGAGADAQPRRVLVEHQTHRREHPQRGVGDTLVEVADQHRAPRRDDHRRVDRREVLGDAGLQHAERHGCAQRDPAVVLGDPADRRAGDRWPGRPGLRGSLKAVQQRW